MKTQISRFSFRPEKRYSAVYQQQGRMITDADWNELVEILRVRLDAALGDVVGSGAPRRPNGLLALPVNAQARLVPVTLYVDGIRGEIAARSGASTPFDYREQADFPAPPALPASGGYILYADLWQRSVTPLEDTNLLDPGLHGADTCSRGQTMLQVKWCPISVDPETASFNPVRGNSRLRLALRQAASGSDPCDPCAANLADEVAVGNYLFRVEVHDVKGPADKPTHLVLKWSAENAAEHYPVDATNALPPRSFTRAAGYVYEFFSDSSEKQLGVHLDPSFAPARLPLADAYKELLASERASLNIGAQDSLFVRRWDGYCRLKFDGNNWLPDYDAQQPVGSENHAGLDSGVYLPQARADAQGYCHVDNGELTLTLGSIELKAVITGSKWVAGDYWLAVVRERAVATDRLQLLSPEPVGIVHHYLRLAQVDANQTVTILPAGDAGARRFGFPPLNNLTADRVGYDPQPKAVRWRDILEVDVVTGQPPLPVNLQQAIDELVDKLESSDLGYNMPTCSGLAQTVRSLLFAAMGSGSASKVKDVLDTILCRLDASQIPYQTSAARTIKEEVDNKVGKTGAQTMAGPLTIQGDLTVQANTTTQTLGVTGIATVGSFRMAQGAANNWVLTSDPAGVGTWKLSPAGAWVIAGNHIYSALSGNVGIGTSTPVAKLDIEGDALLGYETSLVGASMPSNFGAPLKSGFYQNGGTDITGDVPDTSHVWTHLINARHSNTANNHQLQIASSYTDNDKLYFRKIAASPAVASNPAWRELATRGGNSFVGGQSVTGSLALIGNQTVTGTLSVTGNQSNTGTLSVTGNISSDGQLISVKAPWGNTPGFNEYKAYIGTNAIQYGNGGVQIGSLSVNVDSVHLWNPNRGTTDSRPGSFMNLVVNNLWVRGTFNNSDKRLKTNIRPLKGVLDRIAQLRAVSFSWKVDKTLPVGGDAPELPTMGLVAQELKEVFPELVSENGGYLGINTSGLTAVLLRAMQEQQAMIEKLTKDVAELRAIVKPQSTPRKPRK